MGDRTEDRKGILPKEEGCTVSIELVRIRDISGG
jgi:hypothetical protein